MTEAGHRAILAAPWYLNYIETGSDWVLMYKVEPLSFNAADEAKKLVLGGEVITFAQVPFTLHANCIAGRDLG